MTSLCQFHCKVKIKQHVTSNSRSRNLPFTSSYIAQEPFSINSFEEEVTREGEVREVV